MTVPGYAHPEALGHRAIGGLFDGPIVVQEKVDGSQVGFSLTPEGLLFRSRKTQIFPKTAAMFARLVESITERADLLRPEWVYYGEYLSKPKHNALAYERCPRGHVAVFDVMTGGQNYLGPDELATEAEHVGLEAVPLFYHGEVSDPLTLRDYLERDSFLGGTKVEGVVVKNYARFGVDHRPLMGKLVRDDFKERNAANWKKENHSSHDIVQLLSEQYRTEARWAKAVQHLTEDGLLEGSPRDIGKLMAEIPIDIQAECEDEIKEALWSWAWPNIKRGVTRGVPEWYKARLMEQA